MDGRRGPGDLPDDVLDVLDAVARAAGAQVSPVGRLPGGANAGVTRLRVAGAPDAVVKVEPRLRADHLDDLRRARRVVEHVRARGYPTPAWLAVGQTDTSVWHVVEHVDAAPAPALTAPLVEQLLAAVELQAGQATEDHDHAAYAEQVVARLVGQRGPLDTGPHAAVVAPLVARLRSAARRVRGAPPSTDVVHADLNPGNVLVRDGVVVALVDIANAGRGTRATDLVTLHWHADGPGLDAVRRRLAARVLDLVGPDAATTLVVTQVVLRLEWRLGLGEPGAVRAAVERGHRALDDLG
ncbi:phosphotransferase [Nocardioides litoris]|uniref:phosphotransferase n=1 Tax=Nocardioides litoris TaxID=1926648 RepID=UPI0011240000|nr:phosphotransferase [Nocardioides litoris]